MTQVSGLIPTHAEYEIYEQSLRKVRDSVEGATKIKHEGQLYLKDPSKKGSDLAEYNAYKDSAEFDGQPADTLNTMIGKMRFHKSTVELPDLIDYLMSDADGDGSSFYESISCAASNIIQMGHHFVLADYDGLADVDLQSVSIADAENLDTRAKLKHYTRESAINYNFSKVNGRMQLSWICFLEKGVDFNPDSYVKSEVYSYLILGLDEDGNYYQQKIVKGTSNSSIGERDVITVNGQPLKFIPLEVITSNDSEFDKLPTQEGFLSKICDAALHKYEISAVHKSILKNMPPTIMTTGWKSNGMEIFQQVNGGRNYIETGGTSVNNLPDGVTYDVLSADVAMDPFQWYLTYIDKKILSMGGVAKQEMSNMTATEADINANEQNSMLESLAKCLESSFKRLSNYCLMFEGGVSQEQVMLENDNIVINLPREFATPKMSTDEVRVLIELNEIGQMTDEELDAQLKTGGWRSKDFALNSLEEQSPTI